MTDGIGSEDPRFPKSLLTEAHFQSFKEQRPLLFGIAWRMLGNPTDAEDILQEALIRWEKAGASEIRSPRAYLVTMVTRLCLNHLDLARVKNEFAFSPELILQNVPSIEHEPGSDSDLADSLDAAFSIMLQRLSPIERAVFLLREVFDRDYSEVARILEKSEENCRQILRRARNRIAGQECRFEVTLQQQEFLLQEFLNATTTGDVERLTKSLTTDVSLVRDGDNLGAPAPEPVWGAQSVAQFLISSVGELIMQGSLMKRALFNGTPMLLIYGGEKPLAALALMLNRDRIKTIYLVKCPIRLRSLAVQCPP